ncbi:hypothetical protein GCM10010872_14200 [Dyella flava]|nr:hypothetical protein GCM10010872_14200 [Dyella flava]
MRVRDMILTAVVALIVLTLGLKKPSYNWDMIGYVAVAFSAEGYHGVDLNKATYDSVRSEVNASTFDQWVQGDYRETVYRDPSSLAQQLPFYRIRVLYVGLVRMVHAIGFGYPRSTYVVSAAFAALSVVLLALVGREIGAPVAAVPLVVAFSGFIDVAGLSTPDALACFCCLLTIHALVRESMLVFVVAALLPLVRTDLLLLSMLVCAHAFIFGKRTCALASMLVACMLYGLVVRINGAYGWLTLFNTSLIHKTAYPAALVPSHRLGDYLRPYVSLAYDFTMQPHFVIFALAIWFLLRHGTRTLSSDMHRLSAVFVVPMAFVALHLLLFPAITYRFFVFAASVVAIGLIGQMQWVNRSRHIQMRSVDADQRRRAHSLPPFQRR